MALGVFYSLAPSLEQLCLKKKKSFSEPSFYVWETLAQKKLSNLSKFSSCQRRVWLWTRQPAPCPTCLSASPPAQLPNPPTQVQRVGLLINNWKGWWINLTFETPDFPGGSDGKASAYNAGDPGSIPGLGRSPGEGNGNRLQYSCLENPMDRGAWWATVHGVARSQTWLSDFTHFISGSGLLTLWDDSHLLWVDVFILRLLVNVPEALGALRHFSCALSPALMLWRLRAEKDKQVPTNITLELPSPSFLAPVMGFMEDNYSTDQS